MKYAYRIVCSVVVAFLTVGSGLAQASAKPDVEYEQAIKGLMDVQMKVSDMMMPMVNELSRGYMQALLTEKEVQKGRSLKPQDIQDFSHVFSEVVMENLGPELKAMEGKMYPIMEDLYRKTFTRQEVIDMYVYYSSPSGKSTMAKMPVLMQSAGQALSPLIVAEQKRIRSVMDSKEEEIFNEVVRRLDKAR